MPGTGALTPYIYPSQSGNRQSGNEADYLGFIKQLAGGGGLFGLGDVATGGLFTAGGALLGGLGSLLGGKSDAEKRGSEVYDMAKNQLGQDILDPDQYLAEYYRSIGPELNMMAEGLNQRLGLDSGAAQGALASSRQSLISRYYLETLRDNARLKAARDQNYLQIMASLSEA